jgi:hypothetical protein
MQDKFDNAETYMAVHGRFTYKDAAGRDHWTQFCSINTPRPIEDIAAEITEKCVAFADVDDEK